MAKFIKIDKLLLPNGTQTDQDKEKFVYIRPRDIYKVIHWKNMDCRYIAYVDGGRTITPFNSDVTDIVTYKNDTIRTLMDTGYVLEMINAALEEEELKRSELYKK